MTVVLFGISDPNKYRKFANFPENISNTQDFLTTSLNTSKLVKNTPLRVVFSTLFSVFGNGVKRGLSCLVYYGTRSS